MSDEHSPTDFARLRELATLLHAAPNTIEALDQLEAKTAEAQAAIDRAAKAHAELEQARADHERTLADLTAQQAAARVEHDNALVAAEAAHTKKLADLTAQQVVEQSARADKLSRREAALVAERRELEAEWERVSGRERAIEMRAADLSNRLHGSAA
jgi:chromosome segregation ATPase